MEDELDKQPVGPENFERKVNRMTLLQKYPEAKRVLEIIESEAYAQGIDPIEFYEDSGLRQIVVEAEEKERLEARRQEGEQAELEELLNQQGGGKGLLGVSSFADIQKMSSREKSQWMEKIAETYGNPVLTEDGKLKSGVYKAGLSRLKSYEDSLSGGDEAFRRRQEEDIKKSEELSPLGKAVLKNLTKK